MQRQQSFGRRAPPQRETQSQPFSGPMRAADVHPTPVNLSAPANLETPDHGADIDSELEEWKAARKRHKRSFREPWRSVAIAATLGFGVSSWLLPDSVANVAELVTTGLGLASLYAGLRKRRGTQD